MSRASRRPPRPPAPAPLHPARAGRPARSLRALAVLVVLVTAFVAWQAVATRAWRPAQATVGEVETRVAPFLDLPRLGIRLGRQRHQAFTYRYQVGPMSYEGREDGAPAGSRLVVYYDPADPGHSMVGKPRLGPALAASGASLGLLAAGLWLARRAKRRSAAR
jgi:hypothetical protein